MNRNGKILICISLVLLLVVGGLMFLAKPAGVREFKAFEPIGPMQPSRAGDYVTVNDGNALGNFYPGDEDEEFVIDVKNVYDGNLWDDDWGPETVNTPLPYGNGKEIAYVKVSIMGVRNSDHQPITTSPLENLDTKVYNEEGDIGYNITYWSTQTFFTNKDFDEFSFDVKEKCEPGDYAIEVKVTLWVRTSWDNDKLKFNLTSLTETEFLDFTILSRINLDGEVTPTIQDNAGNIVPLYAGATFQEIIVPVRGKGGITVSDVTATMTPTLISLSNNDPAYIANLASGVNSELAFRIEVPSTLDPQVITGCTLTITYTRDDQGDVQTITEDTVNLRFVIAYTPLLTPPAHNDYAETADKVEQGDGDHTFDDLTFTNSGNVPLQDVVITLDLSNARYFNNGDFYYDESNNGIQRSLRDIEMTIDGPIEKGKTSTVEFTPAVLNKYLPPGVYKIPIDYEAWYYDTGEVAGSTAWKQTTDGEYWTITGVIGEQERPYIFIEVEDDNGFSADANVGNLQITAGSQQVNFNVAMTSYENYNLNTVEFTLENADGNGSTDIEIVNGEWDTPNWVAGGWFNVPFTVSVAPDAEIGVHKFNVVMNALNQKNEDETMTFEIEIEVVPIAPALTIVGVATDTKIKAGEEFQLQITIMNTGGSTASDITVLNVFNTAQLTSNTNTAEITELEAGAVETVTYTVVADENIDTGVTYASAVQAKWTDTRDNQIQYNGIGNAWVRSGEKEEEKSQYSVAGSILVFAIVFSIVFFIFALLVFMGLMMMKPKPAPAPEEKPKRGGSTPPPAPAKAEPMPPEDDDKEDDPEAPPDLEPPEDIEDF